MRAPAINLVRSFVRCCTLLSTVTRRTPPPAVVVAAVPDSRISVWDEFRGLDADPVEKNMIVVSDTTTKYHHKF